MLRITSPNIISKSAAIHHIDTVKKPVIFWDTCSFLDIIRLPIPERKQSAAVIGKVIEIKNKIVSKDIVSLSSVLCVREFNDHIENYVKMVELASKNLSGSFNNFIDFINKIQLGATPIPSVDLSVYKLEDQLCLIIHAIINETLFVSEEDSFAQFAHFRTKNKIPPAKVKGEYKDCYIWGSCLELRQSSSDKSYPFYFLSSNVTDYGVKNSSDFVTEIKHEATINNITYFSNFNIAHGLLKRDRIL